MKIRNLFNPNYCPHVKLIKAASLATQKCLEKKDSEEISEDSSKFDGITDCTIEKDSTMQFWHISS